MVRNFDQIVDDARYWLRAKAKVRPSWKNEVGNFGFLRHAYVGFSEPALLVTGSEHTTLRGKKFGAVVLRPEEGSEIAPITFRWMDGMYMVMSPLTLRPPGQLVVLDELSGVVLDAVFGVIEPVMSEIKLQIIEDKFR